MRKEAEQARSQTQMGGCFGRAGQPMARRVQPPVSGQGQADGVWAQLKECVRRLAVVVERPFLFSHGCADVEDEDPGVACHL